MKSYLIAFGSTPNVKFMDVFREMCKEEEVDLLGATITRGPGCTNLAIMVADDTPLRFVEMLTFALMPSKYQVIGHDPQLEAGKFQNLLHS